MSAARDTVTDTRLRLRAAGFSPTPVNGKAAVLSGWQNKRDVNDDEIKLWNNLFPHASGTGILTVHTPVFDIDISNEEAAEAVERLARERFEEAGRVLVRIGRPPKRAIPFRSDNAFKKISINLIAANGDTSQKLELLAAGQQLVAFGIHPDTQLPYQWHGGEPGEIKREELPEIDEETAQTLLEDAAELLCRDFGYQHAPGRPRKTHKSNGAEADASDGAGAADWAHLAENIRAGRDLHDSLRDLAAKLVASGMGAGAVVNFLRGLMGTTTSEQDKRWLERRYSIPRLVESAQAKQDEQPPQEGGNDIPATSEEAMALTFADRHAGHLRFVAAWGRWLNYDDSRWMHDDTLHAFDRARVICRETAMTYPKATVTSAKTVTAIERLARSDRRLAATAMQWDASPWLFNTNDATIDLRIGIGRAPDPLDYITKKAGCACAPAGTPHPLWTAFLDRVTDHNVELQQFLQRYIGYCCTGFTTEHVFVFLYGTGANGKGTFINTLVKIFGDYATVAAMSTFLASNNEQHPTDLAKLNGARMVVAQETQKGRRWDETKIAGPGGQTGCRRQGNNCIHHDSSSLSGVASGIPNRAATFFWIPMIASACSNLRPSRAISRLACVSSAVKGFSTARLGPRLAGVSAPRAPLSRSRRQSVRIDEYKPSRRRIAPIPPTSAAASVSARTRSFVCTVKVRRRGRSDNSGAAANGAGTAVGLRPPSAPAPAAPSVLTSLFCMTT